MSAGTIHQFPAVASGVSVPGGEPIQPPAAFITCMPQLVAVLPAAAQGSPIELDFSNLGITELIDNPDAPIASGTTGIYSAFSFAQIVNLSGNHLSQSSVDNLLVGMLYLVQNGVNLLATLDLTGGSNAAPTSGQANAALVALRTAGMTVTTN